MLSLASVTWPSCTTTSRPPSPSTLARAGTVTDRPPLVLPWVMRFGLLAERGGVGVERAEHPGQVGMVDAEPLPPGRQRGGVGCLHRPEAAVAAACVRRAQRAAPGVRHRAEAGRAVRDHHAGDPGALALDAHAVPADVRPAAVQERRHHVEELPAING